MKLSGKQKIFAVISIIIACLSFCLMILDWAIPLNIWIHPILTFVFANFLGFGILLYATALIKRCPAYLFVAAMLLGLAILYILMCIGLAWFYALIAFIVVLFITFVIDYLVVGGFKTEHADNKSHHYKNYKQRIAEKEEQEKNIEKEELPEIKSFKD